MKRSGKGNIKIFEYYIYFVETYIWEGLVKRRQGFGRKRSHLGGPLLVPIHTLLWKPFAWDMICTKFPFQISRPEDFHISEGRLLDFWTLEKFRGKSVPRMRRGNPIAFSIAFAGFAQIPFLFCLQTNQTLLHSTSVWAVLRIYTNPFSLLLAYCALGKCTAPCTPHTTAHESLEPVHPI